MKKILLSSLFLPIFLFFVSPTFASSFSDTFTDVDGTTLHDHNSIWDCENNGNVVIQNNKVTNTVNTTNCVANSFTDGSASIVADFPGQSLEYSTAIMIRYSDANNYYQCNANSGHGYVIFKMYQGNFSVLQNNSGFFEAGEHTISCDASGSTITLKVDGVQRAQIIDSDLLSGRSGFQATTGVLSIDNYISSDNSQNPTPTPTPTLVPTATPTSTPPSTPTNKNQCKKTGWTNFASLFFKNQGACVSFVEKQK